MQCIVLCSVNTLEIIVGIQIKISGVSSSRLCCDIVSSYDVDLLVNILASFGVQCR